MPNPNKKPRRPNRLDVGLAVLCEEQRPGEIFETDEIAQVCGCTRRRVQQLLERAKAKLRFHLYRELGGFKGELPGIAVPLNSHFAQKPPAKPGFKPAVQQNASRRCLSSP